MKTTFEELFSDISVLDKRLSTPTEFHRAEQVSYHHTARLIAKRILLPAMPEGQDPERWKVKVDRALDRITAQLMLDGGMMLAMTSAPPTTGGLANKESRPPEQTVTHNDVREWIRAGLEGSEGGKRITDRDRKILADQGEKGLATIVMRAYYSREPIGSYVRLRRVIQTYLHGPAETSGTPLMDAVAAAWMEHFLVRFPRDLNAHVTVLCRQF